MTPLPDKDAYAAMHAEWLRLRRQYRRTPEERERVIELTKLLDGGWANKAAKKAANEVERRQGWAWKAPGNTVAPCVACGAPPNRVSFVPFTSYDDSAGKRIQMLMVICNDCQATGHDTPTDGIDWITSRTAALAGWNACQEAAVAMRRRLYGA